MKLFPSGNKSGKAALKSFVEKAVAFLHQGVHLLVIDLLPPGKRDPEGIHAAIWAEFEEEEYQLPVDRRLTIASYDAGPPMVAYVEAVTVGDVLPAIPLFIGAGTYIPAPLETSYQAAWKRFPDPMKKLLG